LKKSKISTKQSEVLKMDELRTRRPLTKELKFDGVTVSFLDSDRLRQVIADRVYRYFSENKVCSGEQIIQSEDAFVGASVLLAEIADDVMNFSVQYDES